MLNRDFEHEQETGLCSYCGRDLPVGDGPDGNMFFMSCPDCDEYKQESSEDWDNYDGYGYPVFMRTIGLVTRLRWRLKALIASFRGKPNDLSDIPF